MTDSLKLHCPDIVCEGCATAIQRSLGNLPGVLGVQVGVKEKDVTVEYDASRVSDRELRERLQRAGFPSS